jgi:hypothetical protein
MHSEGYNTLSVCLSVTMFSATTRNKRAKDQSLMQLLCNVDATTFCKMAEESMSGVLVAVVLMRRQRKESMG